MSGGDGIDTLSYAEADTSVVASLATGTGTGGFSFGDTFEGFENLTGGNFGDVLYGNDQANIIRGGGGGDWIDAGAGDDRLFGGAGDEVFIFNEMSGRDTIHDFTEGVGLEDIVYLELGDAFDTFAEVMSVATFSGGNTIFNFSADTTLTLVGVGPLVETDFFFDSQ